MTLPVSGPISISQIAVELGRPSNASVSFHETAARTLAGKPTGPVSITDFYGKSSYSAIWSGSSAASVAVFQTSVTMFREYFTSTGGVGAWATAYTDGTFSSTTSQALYSYTGLGGGFYFYAGFQTSGNLLRAIHTVNSASTYGAWMSFDKVTKWSGSTNANNHGYESSGGSFRAANYYYGYRGEWITLT